MLCSVAGTTTLYREWTTLGAKQEGLTIVNLSTCVNDHGWQNVGSTSVYHRETTAEKCWVIIGQT